MKKYINKEHNIWYDEGNSMTAKLEGGSIFSGIPTEEQLISWGYEEFIPTPIPEPTEEEQLREQKMHRLIEIEEELKSMDYLTSKYIDGEDMSQYGDWQNTRKQLRQEYRDIESQLNHTTEA